jgi:hypothetical protein
LRYNQGSCCSSAHFSGFSGQWPLIYLYANPSSVGPVSIIGNYIATATMWMQTGSYLLARAVVSDLYVARNHFTNDLANAFTSVPVDCGLNLDSLIRAVFSQNIFEHRWLDVGLNARGVMLRMSGTHFSSCSVVRA